MTDRVIRIIVDTGQAEPKLRRFGRSLDDTDRKQKQTKRSTDALGQAFRTLVTAISVRQIVRAADAYTNIGNRIRLVTDSTAEYNTVQDELLRLSQNTRTSLQVTAELYERTARATEDLGLSQREVVDLVTTVSQALQISGATASEASNGVRQFTQGLAGGIIRAEEFNSIIEQTPRLATAIADGLDIGIGELRRRVIEGELLASDVLRALQGEAAVLNEEFADITPTVESTITTIQNFATVVVGSFNEAAGITEGLVEIFELTGDESVELAQRVREVGLAFREFVEVATVAVAIFAEEIAPRFGAVQAEIVKIIAAITRDEDLFNAALQGQQEFEAELEAIQSRAQERLDEEFEAIRRNNEERRKVFADRDANLNESRGGGGGGDEGGTISAEQQKVLDQQAELIAGLERQVRAQTEANETGGEYAEILARINIETLGAVNNNEEFVAQAVELSDALARQREQAEAIREERERQNDRQERANEIIRDSRDAQDRYNDSLAELQGLLADGFLTPEQFDRALENLDELDSATDDFFTRARENSQDILAGFLESGLQDLDDFGREFANLILRLSSQALAANIFDALLGQQGGGGAPGILQGIFGGRQFGGGVQGGQPVNTNEGGRFGAEVFVPNVGGTIVPTGGDRAAGAAMAPPQVNITNVNTIDNSEIVGAFNEGAGDTVLLNRISTRRQAFRRALGV